MSEYTFICFFTFFTKRNNFCEFLFVSREVKNLIKWVGGQHLKKGSTLKGKNLLRSKFFPISVDSFQKGGKNSIVASFSV